MKHSPQSRLAMLIEILCIGIIFGVVLMTAYWHVEEDTYYIDTVPKNLQQVSESGLISFDRYVCPKKFNVSAQVTERIIFEDGSSIYVNSYPHPPVLKCGKIGVKKFVPTYLGEGKYFYGVTVEYQINPLKKMTKILTPIPFEVKNGY